MCPNHPCPVSSAGVSRKRRAIVAVELEFGHVARDVVGVYPHSPGGVSAAAAAFARRMSGASDDVGSPLSRDDETDFPFAFDDADPHATSVEHTAADLLHLIEDSPASTKEHRRPSSARRRPGRGRDGQLTRHHGRKQRAHRATQIIRRRRSDRAPPRHARRRARPFASSNPRVTIDDLASRPPSRRHPSSHFFLPPLHSSTRRARVTISNARAASLPKNLPRGRPRPSHARVSPSRDMRVGLSRATTHVNASTSAPLASPRPRARSVDASAPSIIDIIVRRVIVDIVVPARGRRARGERTGR